MHHHRRKFQACWTDTKEWRVGVWSRGGQVDQGGRAGGGALLSRHEHRAQGDCRLLRSNLNLWLQIKSNSTFQEYFSLWMHNKHPFGSKNIQALAHESAEQHLVIMCTMQYTIRSIVCETSCHSVTRSLGHSVPRSLGHSVIRSLGHLVTRLLGYLVTQSPVFSKLRQTD